MVVVVVVVTVVTTLATPVGHQGVLRVLFTLTGSFAERNG
jgi:hypothetical protein